MTAMGILETISLLALLMIMGYALRLIGYGEEFKRILSFMLVYFMLPALMFYVFATRSIPSEGYAMALLPVAHVAVASVIVGFIAAKVLHLERKQLGSVILASSFPNSAFLPYPLMIALYGELLPAAVYVLVCISLHNIYAATIGGAMGSRRGGASVASVAKEVLTFPPLVASIAGLAAKILGITPFIPSLAMEALWIVGVVGSYLSLVLVGSSIPLPSDLYLDKATDTIIAWRLLASPLLHVGLALYMGLKGIWLGAAIIEGVMPPATMNVAFAAIYGLDTECIAKAILVTTITGVAIVLALAALGLLPGLPP